MKPLGITPHLRVIRPTAAEDAIWDAVAAAIEHGWSPEDFRVEAASAWEHELKEAAKHAASVLGAKR